LPHSKFGRQVKAIKRTNKHTPKKKTGDEIMCFKIKYDKLEKVDLVITDTPSFQILNDACLKV
jgi:hypothetical protein